VLCDLFDGKVEHIVLTGAPNLFEYKGKGKLPKPLKVAYAKEGTTLYDGHAEGQVLMTLKRAKIRGVESYSMACSEKELGISDEHEGIIILEQDAPVGMPLADYMGDAVLDIAILPNNARNASMFGIAREVAALTGKPLKKPDFTLETSGEGVGGLVSIDITNPELNPRFTLGLIRDVTIKPSPYKVQRRLRLAGIRPISNIVDATNYAMLEFGEPLHAFDYDILKKRAGDKPVKIITRTAKPGEKLITLDGEERQLQESNVLVCDEHGSLAMAGVMGGLESEVTDTTRNVLLEGAAWNFINIRRTSFAHALHSEASFRFSRGVHPDVAIDGTKRGLHWMAQWSGGRVAPGVVDNYPLRPTDPTVTVTPRDVKRLLGIELTAQKIADYLSAIEFECQVDGEKVTAKVPPIRMDIGEGVVGLADVLEEIARLYGYDNIPETRMTDTLPPQMGNPRLDAEEQLKNQLVRLGLQEVINYRMTSPEREARAYPKNAVPAHEYVRVANPIAPERSVLRRSLLASVLENIERNARLRESLALFELGPAFIPTGDELPDEPLNLAIALSGKRYDSAWDVADSPSMDFYDLKGLVEAMMTALHLEVSYTPGDHAAFHPGKCASVMLGDQILGVFGELHPLVWDNYDFVAPVLAANFDAEILLAERAAAFDLEPVSTFPPVLEDIALIVDEAIPADKIEGLIRQTGGKMLADVRLFDVYRGEQIGIGKKSLAYALMYQSFEKTLTDKDAAAIRNKIVRRLEHEVGAKLRS